MKPIAAENKRSLNTGITSEVKKNEETKIHGTHDLPADMAKKIGKAKTVVSLTEQSNKIKYKKDHAVWY
jgi:hypothetical protein